MATFVNQDVIQLRHVTTSGHVADLKGKFSEGTICLRSFVVIAVILLELKRGHKAAQELQNLPRIKGLNK